MIFGPSPEPAEAKVFERLLSFTSEMPPYLFEERGKNKPIKVLVNGNTTWLTVAKTNDDIKQVLKFYNDQYLDQPYLAVSKDVLSKVDDKDYEEQLKEINRVNKKMSEYQHFKLVRENYGFLGIVDFQDKENHLGSDEFSKAVEAVEQTGDLGKFATGRLVIAMRGKQANQTTVLNVWTGDNFSLNGFKKDSSGNMPGFNIADVPVHHTNKREFSVEQDNPALLYRLVQYRGDGSLISHVLFFHTKMKANGWKVNPNMEHVLQSANKQNFMFYSKDNRECTIQVEQDKTDSRIRTTVIESTIKTG
jgi:hypothetical protein